MEPHLLARSLTHARLLSLPATGCAGRAQLVNPPPGLQSPEREQKPAWSTPVSAQAECQTSACCDGAVLPERHALLSMLPSPPVSWLPFLLTRQKALRVLRRHLLLKFPFGYKSFPFHRSVSLSEQGIPVDCSISSFLITILV